MRDLTNPGFPVRPSPAPKGLAFDVADLVMAQRWALAHNARMTIRLDHGSEHEEYEEVLEFRQGRKSEVRFILWHSGQAVFIQPLPGRRRRAVSVAAALQTLQAEEPVG
jgi:hypothetical protein